MAAIRLCMERLIPSRKDRTVSFSLPEINGADDGAKAMAGVLRALADGDMTPIEASNVSGVIEIYRETLETSEFEGRLKSLEQVTNHKKLKKRIDKVCVNLSTKERSLAILDALGCDYMSTAKSLLASAPMKTYSQRGAAITSFVDVIELISLNFDRGYYSMIAALLEINLTDSGGSLAQQHHTEHELRGFIGGMQMFSDHIDISLDRLLTFSIANDQKFLKKRLKERELLSNEDTVLAETICTMIEDMWKRRAPYTAFNVAAATD
jgi:hypothetical protein